jgi:oligoribonuclease
VQPQLAGSSVHVDRQFLQKGMPKVANALCHRIVDVSTINELCKRWCYGKLAHLPTKSKNHRALDDVLESIRELAAYKQHVFNVPVNRKIKVDIYELQDDGLYSWQTYPYPPPIV